MHNVLDTRVPVYGCGHVCAQNAASVVWFGVPVLGVLDVGRQHDCRQHAACRSAHAIASAEDSMIVLGRFFGFSPIYLSMPIALDHLGRSFIAERSAAEICIVTYTFQVYAL